MTPLESRGAPSPRAAHPRHGSQRCHIPHRHPYRSGALLAACLGGLLLLPMLCLAQASPERSPEKIIRELESDPAGWAWAVRHRSDPLRGTDPEELAAALEAALARTRSAERTGADWRRAMIWAVAVREHRTSAVRPRLQRALVEPEGLGDRLCIELAASMAALTTDESSWLAQLRRPEPCVVAGAVRQLAGLAEPRVGAELRALLERHEEVQGTVLHRTLGELRLRNDFAGWWQTHTEAEARAAFVLERVGMIFDTVPAGHRAPLTESPHGRWLFVRAVELRLSSAEVFDRRSKALAIELAPPELAGGNPPRARALHRLEEELQSLRTENEQDTP